MKKNRISTIFAVSLILFTSLSIEKSYGQKTPKLSDPEIASAAVVANQNDIDFAAVAKQKSKNPLLHCFLVHILFAVEKHCRRFPHEQRSITTHHSGRLSIAPIVTKSVIPNCSGPGRYSSYREISPVMKRLGRVVFSIKKINFNVYSQFP